MMLVPATGEQQPALCNSNLYVVTGFIIVAIFDNR